MGCLFVQVTVGLNLVVLHQLPDMLILGVSNSKCPAGIRIGQLVKDVIASRVIETAYIPINTNEDMKHFVLFSRLGRALNLNLD